jgi:hypothetical protein
LLWWAIGLPQQQADCRKTAKNQDNCNYKSHNQENTSNFIKNQPDLLWTSGGGGLSACARAQVPRSPGRCMGCAAVVGMFRFASSSSSAVFFCLSSPPLPPYCLFSHAFPLRFLIVSDMFYFAFEICSNCRHWILKWKKNKTDTIKNMQVALRC